MVERDSVDPTKGLRIGCVKYLNARPLIRGWSGDVCLENPAALCAKLATSELDAAMVSSFEFLRHPIYRIVNDVSISSDGPVYSVVVAHQREIAEIEEIVLDPASETSVNLLRCLLAQQGLRPRLISKLTAADPNSARLLIGDQAIRFRRDHPEFQFWDLGAEWKKNVGLPFVYALWLIRPEVSANKALADRLRALRDENLANLDQLIAAEKDFDHDFCAVYYRKNLRFSFGEEEMQGLRSFQKLCENYDLLPSREIEFVLV